MQTLNLESRMDNLKEKYKSFLVEKEAEEFNSIQTKNSQNKSPQHASKQMDSTNIIGRREENYFNLDHNGNCKLTSLFKNDQIGRNTSTPGTRYISDLSEI